MQQELNLLKVESGEKGRKMKNFVTKNDNFRSWGHVHLGLMYQPTLYPYFDFLYILLDTTSTYKSRYSHVKMARIQYFSDYLDTVHGVKNIYHAKTKNCPLCHMERVSKSNACIRNGMWKHARTRASLRDSRLGLVAVAWCFYFLLVLVLIDRSQRVARDQARSFG